MKRSPVDVCVVTTIHSDFDARVYDRGIRVLAESGLRVGFVGPWPYDARSGVAPEDWRTTPRARTRRSRPLAALRVLRTALGVKAKVYHFHDLDFVPSALVLKALTGAKVVYDVHENYPEDMLYHRPYLPVPLRRPFSWLVDRLERFAVPRFDAAVVVVPSLEQRLGPIARRIETVRNYSRLEARPDLEHAPNILYSGGVTRYYGALTMLEIARELKRRGSPVRLVVVDKFAEPDLRPIFTDAIAREGLPLDITPLVPPGELDRVMRLGAVALVPDEPSPNAHMGLHAKFFDYMAMGLPIVASDISNARALLEATGCGILVPPSNAAAFVDAAEGLLADPARMQALRDNGLRAFREHYSWRNEADKLVGLMRDLSGAS